MFASTAILSFVGGQLVDSIVNDQFGWAVDWITFLFVMINFGFVGVISIFYQKGTPKFVQNGYLVLVSVILAWEFSMWPEVSSIGPGNCVRAGRALTHVIVYAVAVQNSQWTTIVFCFMFAVYDLCAVLTPCGPLKCLIGLIQEKQAPLPGLLYEADVRDGVTNQPRQNAAAAGAATTVAATAAVASTTRTSNNSSSQSSSNNPPAARKDPQRSSSSTASDSSRPSGNTSNNNRAPRPLRPLPPAPAASVPENFNRPRNVLESDFTTYECETLEALIELLSQFYRTFSPEDVWKAPQVAEKFFPTQDRLWLLIFHKYRVCSCSMDMPCTVQARQDAKAARRAAEEDDEGLSPRSSFSFIGNLALCADSLTCCFYALQTRPSSSAWVTSSSTVCSSAVPPSTTSQRSPRPSFAS